MANDRFIRQYQEWINPILARDLELKTTSRPSRIVDMGVGPGFLSRALARRFPEATVIGVDINPAMLDLARDNLAGRPEAQRIELVKQDVHALSFEDRCADVVISWSCYHHWADPVRGLAECWRILRPGGILSIFDVEPSPEMIPYLQANLSDPEIAGILVKSLREAIPQQVVGEHARAAGIVGFEIKPFELDMAAVLDCIDEIEEPARVSEPSPVNSIAWALTARR
ncbi:class I SAM-dependent methyltransferase [Sorangium sp. So ce1036]|uniref:class I SAM-dependent methyltransferase n=1 Tax=Sorangium sp. So ce1036 TaxID=3133328 RepID=UPI003EFCBB6D